MQITTASQGEVCADVITEYQEKVSIGTLPAGDYTGYCQRCGGAVPFD